MEGKKFPQKIFQKRMDVAFWMAMRIAVECVCLCELGLVMVVVSQT
jgi:hypothetical protein